MANDIPVLIHAEEKTVLIFGGGAKALEKVRRLLAWGCTVTLIAASPMSELCALEDGKLLRILRHDPVGAQSLLPALCPILAVIADVEDAQIPILYRQCREMGILVNCVDRVEFCDFFFPAVVRRGKLTVAVSTDGASPGFAARLRDDIAHRIPERTEEILDWLSECRGVIKKRTDLIPSCLPEIYRALMDAAFANTRPLDADEVEEILQKYRRP